MKRLYFILLASCLVAASLAGCSADEQAKGNQKQEEKPKKAEKEKAFKDAAEYAKLNSFMEEQTGGKIKVLHESDGSQEHELGDLEVTLESHEIVELKGVSGEFSRIFNDERDGKVAVAHYTIHNAGKKDLYYMPAFRLVNKETKYRKSNEKTLLPSARQIATKINRESDYVVKAGETVTGFEAYPLTEQVAGKATAMLRVPVAMTKKNDVTSLYGSEGKLHISLNDMGEKKLEHNAAFYKDGVITDDMGIKRMIKEKKEIDRKAKLDEAEVTLNGYQFTRFKPNDDVKQRFEKYKHGIVLLTAEFTVKNEGKRMIKFANSTLHMNDKTQRASNDIMLANNASDELIKKGESRNILQVYLIDGEQYDKILKSKRFIIEFGPLFYEGETKLFGNEKVEIPLPN